MRRQRGSFVSAALLLLAIAGCHRTLMPTPNLYAAGDSGFASVPEARQSSIVEVLYATDRAPIEKKRPEIEYGIERSRSLAFGTCSIRLGDALPWPELVDASTQRRKAPIVLTIHDVNEVGRFAPTPWEFQLVDGKLQTKPEVFRQEAEAHSALHRLLDRKLAESPDCRDAFVFIHGFNNSFEDAALVTAQLHHFLGRRGVPIVYSWPAGHGLSVLGYSRDRESGEYTIFHLKQFLKAVAEHPGIERIHLLAHSRGTDVLMSALRELNLRYRGEAAEREDASLAQRRLNIGNVVLAAPDLDLEVTLQRIAAERVNRICEQLTIYLSPDDLALAFAKYLFGSLARLGGLTPEILDEDFRYELGRVPGVTFVDARVKTDFVGHSYFYSNPAVSSDLILVIRDGRPPGAEHGRPLERGEDGFWTLRDDYLKSIVVVEATEGALDSGE